MLMESGIKNVFTVGSIERLEASEIRDSIDSMMGNLAISTPILRVIRDILSRTIKIRSVDTKEEAKEITKRLKSIIGFEDYIYDLAFLIFGELSVFEKVYGKREEESDIRLYELVKLPNQYIGYELEEHQATNGLFYTDNDGNEIGIDSENFLVSIYGYSIDNPLGYGLLRYGVVQAWTDLESLEAQLRGLREKYGDIIPVFGYEASEASTEKGLEAIQERIESIKEIQSSSVIAIPLGGDIPTLKEGFQFISLSDLHLEMHEAGIKNIAQTLETFLMGANFSSVDAGSNAKDEVQSNQKDRVTHHIARIVRKELQKILIDDSILFGYNSEEFEVVMVEYLTEREENEFEQRRITTEKMKAVQVKDKAVSFQETINAIADLKFNGLDDNLIAEYLDVDIAIVTPVIARQVVGNSISKDVEKQEGDEVVDS